MVGAHGNAGAVGHLTVEPGGRRCGCGARGCLDAYASATALRAEFGRPLRRATPSTIERTGIMIARAIASTAAVLDVTRFSLGGVVVDTFGAPMLDAVHRELSLRSRLEHLRGLEVDADVGSVSPLVGAAAIVRGPRGAVRAIGTG